MSLEIYLRGKTYHYRGSIAGKRLRGTTETTDETRARRIADQIAEQAWMAKLDGPENVHTFAKAAMLYLDAQKFDRYLTGVAAHWKDTLITNIKSGAVRQAAIKLFPHHSAATRNRHFIVPTQAIINHSAELELCAYLKVKRFKVVKRIKTPITWAWIQAFMKAATLEHIAALAAFMFLTGSRVSEAIDVRWSDMDFERNTVRIVMSKLDGEEREAHMPPELVTAILAIKSNRNPDARVFNYEDSRAAQWLWRRTCERAEIKFLSFHSCRHGFATTLLHKGLDPVTVAKLGGWKSIKHVVETYGHAQDDKTLSNLLTGTNVTQPNMSVTEKETEPTT